MVRLSTLLTRCLRSTPSIMPGRTPPKRLIRLRRATDRYTGHRDHSRSAPHHARRQAARPRPGHPVHQCQALARRVTAGLARTGTSGSHFSGDLFLAFSTANPGAFRPDNDRAMSSLSFVPWEGLDPFYEAVVQATEEAVVNALVANEDMTGRDGHRSPALPRARVAGLLAAAGRLA